MDSQGPTALAVDGTTKAAIPTEATTIHRALGARRDTPTGFRHNRDNPLPADIVVVDEASMIDLPLMSKLLDAVPMTARLIILGDKDQLSSVEAGAVLGDICSSPHPSDHPQQALSELPLFSGIGQQRGIGDRILHLTHNFRFAEGSGIGAIAEAINRGRADEVIDRLQNHQYPDVELVEMGDARSVHGLLLPRILDHYRDYPDHRAPMNRLHWLGRLGILCAHRTGPTGTVSVNRLVEAALKRHLILDTSDPWYDGRPVMITRNDYQLGLFNGDIGVVCRGAAQGDDRRVFFSTPRGPVSLALSRLPQSETVHAMTVHKSQGSQFDRVVVVLPDHSSPVMTKELLYTAVTRAKKHVTIIGSSSIIAQAVQNPVSRTSGLRNLLY